MGQRRDETKVEEEHDEGSDDVELVTAPLIGGSADHEKSARRRNGGSPARWRGVHPSPSSLSSVGSGDGYDETIARMPVVAAGTRTQYIKVNPWTAPERGDSHAASRRGAEDSSNGNMELGLLGGSRKSKRAPAVVSVHSGTSSSSVYGPGLLRRRRQIRRWICCCCLCGIVLAVLSALSTTFYLLDVLKNNPKREPEKDKTWLFAPNDFPLELLEHSDPLDAHAEGNNTEADATASPPESVPPPYDLLHDFCNDEGHVPPFWERLYHHIEPYIRGDSAEEEEVVGEEEFEQDLGHEGNSTEDLSVSTTWGPCYPPEPHSSQKKGKSIEWPKAIRQNRSHREGNDTAIRYPTLPRSSLSSDVVPWNRCRPGFLIIGAGKCGTSSLYHYLVGHPRVLPAGEKQIHYFKYYTSRSMSWYLSHFPATETFLASGALMTGEASPGYLPYPDVAKKTAERLPGPRIICAGREPLDRAWSSYNYNYVTPLLASLRAGRFNGIDGGRDDDYYRENHMFTFEEMISAELANLRTCLEEDGRGEKAALSRYQNKSWVHGEFARRKEEGEPGLIDLEEDCYPVGGQSNDVVEMADAGFGLSEAPAQWHNLIVANPDKVWDPKTVHLTRSLVGRGLYVFPLEWWYVAFPSKDIYLVCNEEMRSDPAAAMADLSNFLGLPKFDYQEVVSKGMYNVGRNRGDDEVTPWKNATTSAKTEIPISDELLQQFQDFVTPLNERLFALTGRRCPW